jgi:predicted transcriptional regulator YdeE
VAHVVVRAMAASRPTAVLAATTTWPEYPLLWRRLLDAVHANVHWEGRGRKGRNVMLYHDDVPHVEVGVELDRPARVEEPVVRSTLPAGAVAMTVHRGPYDGLGSAHEAVLRWCADHQVRTAGPRWEIYGHWHEDPAQLETEVYWLLGGD